MIEDNKILYKAVISFLDYFNEWEGMDCDLLKRMKAEAENYFLPKSVTKF